jgi:hypothetical protein
MQWLKLTNLKGAPVYFNMALARRMELKDGEGGVRTVIRFSEAPDDHFQVRESPAAILDMLRASGV